MDNATVLNKPDLIPEIRNLEQQIDITEKNLSIMQFKLQELRKLNASRVEISWKESVRWCLDYSWCKDEPFIKTPSSISSCIAYKYGVEITRDIKNKIATTLSIMYNQKLIGRTQRNGKTYYGMADLFRKDLQTLKNENIMWADTI